MKRKSNSSEEARSKSHDSSSAEFDVFLSFRGPDTRTNFTDSLYHVLLDKGIRVFMDKKGIDVGEEIGPEIFQAIDNSKICIPIFSRGYASSSWCLRELEHMMERRKTNKLEVMPIFYDVEPFDVKLGTDVYRDALTLHQEKRGADIVQRWAKALKEVTGIRGWDTKNMGHGELAHLIAREVLVKLQVSCVHISDQLVGMDESVNEVEDLLDDKSKDIRLIGICGMGGIGKTTIAKVVYQKQSINFDACSFISNIREGSKGFGLLKLQRQLVSNILGQVGVKLSSIDHAINMIKDRFKGKKVLIFLDDVDHTRQLMALAAEAAWFGLGSRIVVTTRDKSVLNGFQDRFEHCFIYEAKELNSVKALQLFSKHAFRSISPPNAFLSLSKEVAKKAGGLPLTIEVMGSFLYGKKEAVWQDTLKKMKQFPHKDVMEKLILSYQALDHQQQQMFLDIACFLAGENKSYADYMWDDAGLFPTEGIEVLLSMSLVKIEEINDKRLYPYQQNKLWMHDQLRDLGRSIRYQEMCKDPRNDSRLWNPRGLGMIERKKGTETITVINWNRYALQQQNVVTLEESMKLPFRFLDLSGATFYGDFENFFPELRWLRWHHYYQDHFEATNFCPKNLLILDLSGSYIDEQWGGWTQLKVATKLKVLNLSCCYWLRTTPDLYAYLSLEILVLEGCQNLESIDRSIGYLRRLKHLNLNECPKLRVLPTELDSLEELTELLMCYGHIIQVPSSIGALMNLECLAICGAFNLTVLPDSIGMLKSLAELDVSDTNIIGLPNTIINLTSLKVLMMNRSPMQKLPERIGMLEKLEILCGVDCEWLEIISGDIGRLPCLTVLKLTKTRVENVPELPQNLEILCLSSTVSGKAPEISNLVRLSQLELSFPHRAKHCLKERIDGPFCRLELPSITSLSSYLGCLCCLKELELTDCDVCHIGQLPSSLRKLSIRFCTRLEAVDLCNLENLLELTLLLGFQVLEGSTSLQLNGLERMENLRLLRLEMCFFIRTLPNLSSLLNLKDLTLSSCEKLVEIGGLDKLESLESLSIEHCRSLRSLPDLSHLKKLKAYWLDGKRVV